MSRDALSVVQEFLREDDVQVMKNALTALRVIDSSESIQRLVEVALTDTHPELRQRAEQELAACAPGLISVATGTLQEDLKDPAKSRRAYVLLGSLRNRGWPQVTPGGGLFHRLRLARGLYSEVFPARTWRHYLRTLKPAAVAALIAAVLFLGFLWWTLSLRLDGNVVRSVVAVALLLAPVLAALATPRAAPIGLQLDFRAGLIVEMLVSPVGILVLLILACVGAMLSGAPGSDVLGIGVFLGLVAVLLAAVRLGTLLGWGLFRDPTRGFWAQLFTGSSAGILLFSLVSAVALAAGTRPATDYLLLWPLQFPVAFGLANAYASIDARAGMHIAHPAGKLRTGVCGVLLLGLLVPLVLALLPAGLGEHGPSQGKLPAASSPETPLRQDWQLTRIPDRWPFRVAFPQKVLAEVREDRRSQRDLVLRLYSQPGRERLAEGDDPPVLESPLGKGDYWLEVSESGKSGLAELDLEEVFPQLLERVRRRQPTKRLEPPLSVRVELNYKRTEYLGGLSGEGGTISIERVPDRRRVVVESPKRISADIPDENIALRRDYALVLLDEDGKIVAEADDPPRIQTDLARGTYWLESHTYDTYRVRRYPEWGKGLEPRAVPPFRLVVRLTPM